MVTEPDSLTVTGPTGVEVVRAEGRAVAADSGPSELGV